MDGSRRHFLAGSVAAGIALRAGTAGAATLQPFGVVPTARQLQWQRLETCAFLHFTVNTFTGKEWGYGDEDPNIFAPTEFDPDQILGAMKAGGMRAVVLTCKHHDGFCLWPTKTTEHSIAHSRWMDGKGDVVRAIRDAAHRAGLRFGVYVSPWDRNSAAYGTPAYLPIYRAQITELLSNYGAITEIWFDGANGGDGFYGGAKEKRTIDKLHYYGWPETWALVRKLQPGAAIFSDVGPDIRWVGNERGEAGENCWSTITQQGEHGGPASPGDVNTDLNNGGTPGGAAWMPAECDVSIRKGWFYHPEEDATVRTRDQLIALYDKSVGRGAGLLLNVPPDTRGRIADTDAASLKAFHERIERTFASNLLRGASLRANGIPGNAYHPANLLDGDPDSFWTAVSGDGAAIAVTATFRKPTKLNVVRIREAIQYGQRVRRWVLEMQTAGSEWTKLAEDQSIGNCRIVRLPQTTAASALRLRIVESAAPAALSEWGAYLDPAL